MQIKISFPTDHNLTSAQWTSKLHCLLENVSRIGLVYNIQHTVPEIRNMRKKSLES